MTFVDTGVQRLISYLRGETTESPTYMAVGTDNTSPTTDDVALYNEILRRAIGISITYTASTVTFAILVPSTQANGNILNECGLFDASSDGNMFSRFTHTGITKNTSTEIEYTITLKVKN